MRFQRANEIKRPGIKCLKYDENALINIFSFEDPTKGKRLISSRVTILSQRYNKNTCLTLVKHSFISSLRQAAVLRSGEPHENNKCYVGQQSTQNFSHKPTILA